MPFLPRHIVEPLARRSLEKLQTAAPPSNQLEQWVATKHAEYERAGATPEQIAAWDDYNRKRYSAFLNQKAPPQPDVRMAPPGSSTLGPRGRNISMEQGGPVAPGYLEAVGALPSEGGWLAFKRGAVGLVPLPQVGEHEQPAPEQPAPEQPAPVETRDKRGRRIVMLPADEAVGLAENGQAVDRRGKQLGYLQQTGPMRTAERRPSDVSLEDTDAFAQDTLQQIYGPHVKAVQDNEGKYPAGYFKNVSPADKENIKAGVVELMKRDRGARI